MQNQASQHLAFNPKRRLSGTALAFDFGEKRIGVAVGDLGLGFALLGDGAMRRRQPCRLVC